MMGALLCIINLMPIIPTKMSTYLQDLFEVFNHIASWNCNNPARLTNDLLVHLQIGLYRYFHRLYGMFPCNFMAYLRQEYVVKEKMAIFTHTIKPLLETVKMNPQLVTMNPSGELQQERWKKMEPHDVVYECSRFSLDYLEKPEIAECSCACRSHNSHSHPGSALIGTQNASFDFGSPNIMLGTPGGSAATDKKFPLLAMPSVVGESTTDHYINYTNYECKIWSPSTMVLATPPPTGAIPHTPNQASQYSSVGVVAHTAVSVGQDGSSPPEAAIEATPETTPMKDMGKMRNMPPTTSAARAIFGVPSSSGGGSVTLIGIPAIQSVAGGSTPSSPMRKEPSPFRFPETIVPISTAVVTSSSGAVTPTLVSQKKLMNIMNDRTQSIRYIQQSSVISETTISTPSSPLPPSSSSTTTESSSHPVLAQRNSDQSQPDDDLDSLTTAKEVIVTEYPSGTDGNLNCETEGSPCSQGGLHLPDTRAVMKFRRGVQRLRLYSHCVTESGQKEDGKGLADGSLTPLVKRTRSLPNLSTKSSFSSAETSPTVKNGGGSGGGSGDGSIGQSPQEISMFAGVDKLPQIDSATQTIAQWPQFYEHMFLNILGEDGCKRRAQDDAAAAITPHAMLEQYITMSIKKKMAAETRNWEELYNLQTQLLTLQLQYERHRREVHAERNRRLLGKSRANRELEQKNKTLLDQVARLTAENKKIDVEWTTGRKMFNHREEELHQQINKWKQKFQCESDDTRKLRDIIENLNIRLADEQRLKKEQNIDKELVRGELFDLKNDLRQANYQAELGLQYRQELTRLQSEMILMGEIQLKCKEKLNEMDTLKARDVELDQLQYGYSEEIKGSEFCFYHLEDNVDYKRMGFVFFLVILDIRSSLELKIMQLDAARHRISELEAALSRRDNCVTEEKKQLKAAKEEYQERFNVSFAQF